MFDRGCFNSAVIVVLLVTALPSSADSATKRVARQDCSFSFDYPASWKTVENPEAAVLDPEKHEATAKCAVGLSPPGWSTEVKESPLQLATYPVRVIFWNRGFADAARGSCFVRVSDLPPEERPSTIRNLNPWDWGIWIRQGIGAAHQFRTSCCQGVRGTSWGHDRAKDGSKATIMWECAVVNDRNRHSVVIISDDRDRFHDIVDEIVRTVSFDAASR